jgi:protein AroM
MRVGTLTIGQSPRSDVTPELKAVLRPDVQIFEKGALDRLNMEDMNSFSPKSGEPFFITRMRDGTEVRVTKAAILERMKHCIADLQTEPVDVILLLCTGDFPELESRKILLHPDRILRHLVSGVLSAGRIGVIVPAADQMAAGRKRWDQAGLETVMAAVSPYSGTHEELAEAAHRIKRAHVDLVVLDCMGFNQNIKTLFKEITGRPVLLPRTVAALVINEMV